MLHDESFRMINILCRNNVKDNVKTVILLLVTIMIDSILFFRERHTYLDMIHHEK